MIDVSNRKMQYPWNVIGELVGSSSVVKHPLKQQLRLGQAINSVIVYFVWITNKLQEIWINIRIFSHEIWFQKEFYIKITFTLARIFTDNLTHGMIY